MKIRYLLILCLIPNLFKAQDNDKTGFRQCLDIKAGVGGGFISTGNFNLDNNTTGSHGSVNYPEISLNAKEKNSISSIINLVYAIRFNPFFELNVGASFIQNRYKADYYDIQNENLSSSNLKSTRYITEASGTIVSNNYSFGFAPVFRVFNTKIIFGILNIASASNNSSLSGIKSQYEVTRKAYWPNYSRPSDSVVVLVNEEKVNPNPTITSQIYLPISIGIEQEIPIKTLRYLIGVKCIVSKRAYSPLLLFGYIGLRLSKQYSWRN